MNETMEKFAEALKAWRLANSIEIEQELSPEQLKLESRFLVLYALEHFSTNDPNRKLLTLDPSNSPYIQEYAEGARSGY